MGSITSFHRAITVGFVATVVAVGAALNGFPAAEGSGLLGAALLLFLLVLAVAGVNLVTAGLCLTDTAAARTLRFFPAHAQSARSKAAAFARQKNISALAVSVASVAATGILVGAAQPLLCFVCFALFLLAVSLATAGLAVASSTG